MSDINVGPSPELGPSLVQIYADNYYRPRHLPRLMAVWRHMLEPDASLPKKELLRITLRVRRLIKVALEAERRRARNGHWTYCWNRHMALAGALKAESRIARQIIADMRRPQSEAA